MITIDDIYTAVLGEYGLTKDELFSPTKQREIVDARKICIVLFRDKLRFSYTACGRLVRRDHATAIYSYKVAKALLRTDETIRYHYANVLQRLEREE